MGTVASLLERITRASGHRGRCAVVVSGFGFALGARTVAWQAVCEIWAYKVDLASADEAFLEFVVGADRFVVGEGQYGFDPLAAAMTAVFPSTGDWRDLLVRPPFARNRILLYRRS
jgi:hypothetical protein